MACAKCQFSNPSGFAYCGGCGSELAGAADVSFSGSIAAPTLDELAPELVAERRQLTVLFCDVVDSTGVSERLDPEDWLSLLRAYEEAVGACVAGRGGFVAKHLGDGLLAWFGFPFAREDDAARAVGAALAAVDVVDGLVGPRGERIQARVGVHSGEVVVGSLREGRDAGPDLVGAVPNIAARLQSHARPGQVLLTGAVRGRLGGAFRLRSLGATALRGVREPVALFAVEGPSPAGSRFRLAAGATLTPFVGRRAELERLVAGWEAAAAGASVAITIQGDAGIGKSRLVEVLRTRLGGSVDWEQIDASARLAHTPFGALLDAAPEETVHAFAPLQPGETPPRRRQLVHRRLVERFGRGAGSCPRALVVEDAHWLDPSSIEVLSAVAEAPPFGGRLLLVTTRLTAEAPIGAALLLQPLPPDEATALVMAMTAGRGLGPAARRRVLSRADGVPLYLEEYTRSAAAGDAGTLPATLRDVVAAQIDALGADRATAQVAACVGREFDEEILAATLGAVDRVALRASLARLVQAELLLPVPGAAIPTFAFRHALLADVARGTLLLQQRRPLHGRIAAELQRRTRLREERPEVVAFQLAEAGRAREATAAWLDAARLALGRSANEEAIGHVDAALQLLPELAPEEREPTELALLAARAPALLGARGYAAAETGQTLARLRALARAVGEPRALLVAVNASWAFHGVRGELDEARVLAEELATLAPGQDLPVLAHQALGLDLLWRGRPSEARAVFDAGVVAYRRERHRAYVEAGGQDPGVGCLILSALAAQLSGDAAGALRELARGEALAKELGNPHSAVFAGQTGVWIAQLRGDVADCAERAAALALRATEEGLPHWAATAAAWLAWAATAAAWLAWAAARLGVAPDLCALTEAVERARALGDGATEPWLRWLVVDALSARGEVEAASQAARDALAALGDPERWFVDRLRAVAGGAAR